MYMYIVACMEFINALVLPDICICGRCCLHRLDVDQCKVSMECCNQLCETRLLCWGVLESWSCTPSKWQHSLIGVTLTWEASFNKTNSTLTHTHTHTHTHSIHTYWFHTMNCVSYMYIHVHMYMWKEKTCTCIYMWKEVQIANKEQPIYWMGMGVTAHCRGTGRGEASLKGKSFHTVTVLRVQATALDAHGATTVKHYMPTIE